MKMDNEIPSIPKNPTLNDIVEHIHLQLWSNDDYRRYFQPIWREETIEGSFIMDEAMAAIMIRKVMLEGQTAVRYRIPYPNLQSIVNSLHVVLRRYGIDRMTRRRELVRDNHQA